MNPDSRYYSGYHNLARISTKVISDPMFNRIWYWYQHYRRNAERQTLNLKDPQTFSEKIIWLKCYYDPDNSHVLVDKFLAREHVNNVIGEGHLVPLLDVVDDAGEIDFDSLPNRFAAKASHASGWNIVCEDRSQLDVSHARAKLRQWLNLSYYHISREKQYYHCPHRIVIEQHLKDLFDSDVRDHKFFCFGGVPRLVQIDVERYTSHSQAFYDMDWNRLNFHQLHPPFAGDLPVPEHFEQMQDFARKLSKGLPFARIDLFNHGGTIFFGEITLHPHGGFAPFFPSEFDTKLGNELELPEPTR